MDNDNIFKVSKSDLEDFIWMSYRYAIGRHTIASHSHADTVFRYIQQFKPENIEHCVTDIRRQITSALIMTPVFKSIQAVYTDKIDPVTCLLQYMYENNLPYTSEFWQDHICVIGYDGIEIRERKDVEKQILTEHDKQYEYLYCLKDLLIWAKLCNALDADRYIDVTCYESEAKDPEKTTVKRCYKWFGIAQDGTVERYIAEIDSRSNLTVGWHLNPEYIIKVN